MRHKAFSLVEFLIVLTITIILALIAIPRMNMNKEADAASKMQAQLQTLRAQFELYAVQHGGHYPVLEKGPHGLWDCMTNKTLSNGLIASPYDENTCGPYLQFPMKNSMTGDAKISADGSGGWQYFGNGMIKAVLPPGIKRQTYNLSEADVVEQELDIKKAL